jgi:hypothetical protein
VKAIILELL